MLGVAAVTIIAHDWTGRTVSALTTQSALSPDSPIAEADAIVITVKKDCTNGGHDNGKNLAEEVMIK